MAKKSDSGLTLFLMELLVVILFFSICAAICLNVFGAAGTMAQKSNDRNHATVEMKNMAACYKSTEGNLEETSKLLDGMLENEVITVGFDKRWERITADSQPYCTMTLTETEIGDAVITMQYVDGEMLCSIPVKTHQKGGRGNE